MPMTELSDDVKAKLKKETALFMGKTGVSAEDAATFVGRIVLIVGDWITDTVAARVKMT